MSNITKVQCFKVCYADQYLKRKFFDWSDSELKRERIQCLQEASMIKAEMERRGLSKEEAKEWRNDTNVGECIYNIRELTVERSK